MFGDIINSKELEVLIVNRTVSFINEDNSYVRNFILQVMRYTSGL